MPAQQALLPGTGPVNAPSSQVLVPGGPVLATATAVTGPPTLSLPTYTPGSLTSSGFRARVTAT